MEECTKGGRPPMIDRVWFRARYGQNFPDLLSEDYNDLLDTCIETVYAMFYGVGDIWARQKQQVYFDKTRICYGLLVAWYITDVYPDFASGVATMGGVPITSKSIGGVRIGFGNIASTNKGSANNSDLLSSLKSNAFGAKAYMMIKTSGKLNYFLQVGSR